MGNYMDEMGKTYESMSGWPETADDRESTPACAATPPPAPRGDVRDAGPVAVTESGTREFGYIDVRYYANECMITGEEGNSQCFNADELTVFATYLLNVANWMLAETRARAVSR